MMELGDVLFTYSIKEGGRQNGKMNIGDARGGGAASYIEIYLGYILNKEIITLCIFIQKGNLTLTQMCIYIYIYFHNNYTVVAPLVMEHWSRLAPVLAGSNVLVVNG